jgi:hypothetical protein
MICYHTTDAADEILAGGFADATGSYLLVGMELTGVWLADKPLGGNEGANGDQVLRVAFPDRLDLSDFEVIEDGKPYREWCVPAALINTHATVTLMATDVADVIRYAHLLAEEAPPLTTEQQLLLVSLYARYPAEDQHVSRSFKKRSPKRAPKRP